MNNIKLEYDSPKDKFYLTINNKLITFYGDYATKDYLRELNYTEKQINELIAKTI
jgi:hypothetical protein